MKAKSILVILLLIFGCFELNAQSLSLKNWYVFIPKDETMSLKNKPNGKIYRLREELQCAHFEHVPHEAEGLLLIISEATPTGWVTLYRKPLGANDYKFLAVFYNKKKKPERIVDLCQVSNTYNCEVQDMRWDSKERCLMFNMACPTYSSALNGECSRLFCYDVDKKKMRWQTPNLTSNDIFIFDEQFVYTSYGFTNEPDYVFMFDKKTGRTLSKMKTEHAVQNMELQEKNGERLLYCSDYEDLLYIFNINNK